jgi:hypothetical protein
MDATNTPNDGSGIYDPTIDAEAEDPEVPPYEVRDGSIYWNRRDRQGGIDPVALSNFVARIAEQTVLDDGQEKSTEYVIESSVAGATDRFRVPAKQFAALAWIEERLGAQAIVEPGFQMRDRLRAAIQYLSGSPPTTVEYRHVGWTEIGGEPAYLTADGAIGAQGLHSGIHVDPPDALRALSIPVEPDPSMVRDAVKSSIEILALAPGRVMFPLYAALWRSVLGEVDFAVALVGTTGEFKTSTAILMQQHFGAKFDAAHLPGNWSSTANALEEMAFLAKDVLAIVDDYAPQSSAEATRTLQSVASRLFRNVGNRLGRQRMRADTSVRPMRRPRGLILSTGEDVPSGQSILARLMVLDVEKGDVRKDLLTAAQKCGAAGTYACAMGAFIRWLAPSFKSIRESWATRIEGLDRSLPAFEAHGRTRRIACELLNALWLFTEFAKSAGAVSAEEQSSIYASGLAAIVDTASHQAEFQRRTDPAETFVEAIRSALVSGSAHVRTLDGSMPEEATVFGWQATQYGMRPGGHQVGWAVEDGIYLDPKSAVAAARRVDPDSISVTPETLSKRLYEGGHLASTDSRGGKTRFKVRKSIDGVRREVLHLRTDSVIGEAEDTLPDSAPLRGSYGVDDEIGGVASSAPESPAGSGPVLSAAESPASTSGGGAS